MDTSNNVDHDLGDDPGVVARLRAELGEGALPPEVRQRQLARLQTLSAELGPPASADGQRPAAERARRRWFPHDIQSKAATASVAACAVLVLTTGSAVAASVDALPGEAMHQVKNAVEQVQIATAWSPSRTVEVYLRVAGTRLDEAAALVGGDGDDAQLPTTLDRHEAALAAAAEHAGDDPELLAWVQGATTASGARLAALLDGLPDTASVEMREALARAVERSGQPVPADPGSERRQPAPPGDQPRSPVEPPADPDRPDPSPPERGPGADGVDPPERPRARQDPGPPGGVDRPGPAGNPGSDRQSEASGQERGPGSPQRAGAGGQDAGAADQRSDGLDVPGVAR